MHSLCTGRYLVDMMCCDEILDEGEESGDGILLQLPVRKGGRGDNLPILVQNVQVTKKYKL
jgi:hypothetical protein